MKINLIICVFLHLLNLISREKFEPGGPSSNPGSASKFSLEIKFTIYYHIKISLINKLECSSEKSGCKRIYSCTSMLQITYSFYDIVTNNYPIDWKLINVRVKYISDWIENLHYSELWHTSISSCGFVLDCFLRHTCHLN